MLNFIFNAIKSKFILFLCGGIILLLVIYKFYLFSYNIGFETCNKDFMEYKHSQLLLVQNLENKYREQEKTYQAKTQDLVQQIEKSKETYNRKLLDFERSYTYRLQQSERRASIYSNMSTGPNNSKLSLVNHTAKLDRTIVEGRQLVAELKAIIELRDSQLRQCGEQLKLIGKTYGTGQ